MSDVLPLDLTRLKAAYAAGALSPSRLVDALLPRLAASDGDAVWIARVPADDAAGAGGGARGDAAGGARPAVGRAVRGQGQYRRRRPADHRRLPRLRLHARSASATGDRPAARRRRDPASARPTSTSSRPGLVGVRSPYGVARNPFDPAFIPGGSSSGSAVAVAAGLVSFALGTDTAGSGRVPAAFTNIVGLKPTKGLIPTRGVVPACRSLDCVSIFALTAADAAAVLEVAGGFDPADPFSRADAAAPGPRLRRPRGRRARGRSSASSSATRRPRRSTTRRWSGPRALGAELVEVDLAPFLVAAELLYAGPWVAERTAAVGEFLAAQPGRVLADDPGRDRDRAPVQRRRRVHRPVPAGRARARRGRRSGSRSTCCCCRRHPPSTASTSWRPSRSCSTAGWAPTPTSSTCSTCARWRCRPASGPTACRWASR